MSQEPCHYELRLCELIDIWFNKSSAWCIDKSLTCEGEGDGTFGDEGKGDPLFTLVIEFSSCYNSKKKKKKKRECMYIFSNVIRAV